MSNTTPDFTLRVSAITGACPAGEAFAHENLAAKHRSRCLSLGVAGGHGAYGPRDSIRPRGHVSALTRRIS